MSDQIRIRVGELEYEGSAEFAKEELPELVRQLINSSPQTDSVSLEGNKQTSNGEAGRESEASTSGGDISSYATVAELLAEANWSSEAEKTLLTAAYIQETSDDAITSNKLNSLLDPIDQSVAQPTREFGTLEAEDPPHAIQIGKKGNAKVYKVTDTGLQKVKELEQAVETE